MKSTNVSKYRLGTTGKIACASFALATFLLAAFFGFVAVSLVNEYGSDGVGSAWMFGALAALCAIVTTLCAIRLARARAASREG